MKQRRVYRTDDIAQATRAVQALRVHGIGDDDISLVARSDIELQSIPNRHTEADTDFMPAAVRGAGIGGATGLLAGLAATVITPVGITLVGAVGAPGRHLGVGADGRGLTDPIRQKFDDEIAAGHILVLVDAESPIQERLRGTLMEAGATLLDYEAPASMI